MTTIGTTEITCSCCGVAYESSMVESSDTGGPMTTDLFDMATGEQPLPHLIHTCPNCGFTTPGTREEVVTEEIKTLVKNTIEPRIGDELPPSRKWDFFAIISKASGAPDFAVGLLYLRAAWCAYLENSEEQTEYRRAAAGLIGSSLEAEEVPDVRLCEMTYLTGELYRRIGETGKADAWFDRVKELPDDLPHREYYMNLAGQQRTSPREWIKPPLGYTPPEVETGSLLARLKKLFH